MVELACAHKTHKQAQGHARHHHGGKLCLSSVWLVLRHSHHINNYTIPHISHHHTEYHQYPNRHPTILHPHHSHIISHFIHTYTHARRGDQPDEMNHHHRSGKLKQQNKKHKSRGHLASKRAVKRDEGGKVNHGGGGGGAPGVSSSGSLASSQQRIGNKQRTMDRDLKQDRLNRARQLKEQKRQEQFLLRRLGGSGGAIGPPRVVALLPLSSFCDTAAVRESLLRIREPQQALGEDVVVEGSSSSTTALFRAMKQRFTFVLPSFGLRECLEAVRVADLVVFVLDVGRGSEGAIGEEGDLILSATRAQGLPTAVGVVQGLAHHTGHKSQAELRRFGHRFFETEFGDKTKVAESQNSAQLQRILSTPTSPSLHWRQMRSYLLTDHVTWKGEEESGENGGGTLSVRGYIRGKPLNVDQLVHLPGIGTFPVSKIRKASGAVAAAAAAGSVSMDTSDDILAESSLTGAEREEALKVWAEVDELAGEQTWPTAEEEEGKGGWQDDDDEKEGDNPQEEKKKKKLLKVMSEYQASWFEGDEDEGAGEEDDDNDDNDDDVSMTEDMDTTATIATEHKKQQKKLEDDELEFPDEVQTPDDIPARERFARYRALKSFRTSPWDAYESLPREYGRIFKFQNFQTSHARVVAEMEEAAKVQNQLLLQGLSFPQPGGAEKKSSKDKDNSSMEVAVGEEGEGEGDSLAARFRGFVPSSTYVTLEIVGVTACDWAKLQQHQSTFSLPLTVFSLLRYENKISVLHFNIQKHPACEEPIKSKDRLVFYTGFRSFEARPIFSEHNLNCDKHKFSRFLHGGRFAVATVFGPVSMPPCPVLVFKESVTEAAEGGGGARTIKTTLVASGTLHSVDPDRIILKRILLTGYPVRVKRQSAVVKHMFYNPEDVKWFKPAELSTKLGAAGHIREPIGTHGLMKVRFNRIIQQSDTICLPLFKRVYPKLLDDEGVVEGAAGGHEGGGASLKES